MYEKAAVLLALPYPEYERRVKEFREEFANRPNPFITNAVYYLLRDGDMEFTGQVVLAMVHAVVEYKLHGEDGLKSVKDPCGQGPFAFRRFIFEGVDRGFELRSTWDVGGYPQVLIFVEKEGPPFTVSGRHPGQAVKPESFQSPTKRFRERYGLHRK
jgi:hypothetical protein